MEKLQYKTEPVVQKEGGNSVVTWILAIALFAIVAKHFGAFDEGADWRKWWRGDDKREVDPKPDDDKKDDDKKPNPDDSKNLSGQRLVFVFEKRATTVDQELILRTLGDVVSSHKLSGFNLIDEEDSPAVDPFVAYAGAKGLDIKKGGVFLVKDKKIVKAAQFPSKSSELEKFLK